MQGKGRGTHVAGSLKRRLASLPSSDSSGWQCSRLSPLSCSAPGVPVIPQFSRCPAVSCSCPGVPVIPQFFRCPAVVPVSRSYPAALPVSRLSRSSPGVPVIPRLSRLIPQCHLPPVQLRSPAIPQLPAIQPPPALLFLATRTLCSRCVLPPLLLLGVFFFPVFATKRGCAAGGAGQGAEQTEGAEHSGAMRTGDAALS